MTYVASFSSISSMGRPKRATKGGQIYHVWNRANARMTIFEKDEDYEAFERIVMDAKERSEMRIVSYCLMPNHWHFVLWPVDDGDLSTFTGWMTLTHTQRWHAHRRTVGWGHLYQGRFKSFPGKKSRSCRRGHFPVCQIGSITSTSCLRTAN